MGNNICVFYENVSNDVKTNILNEFKKVYGNSDTKEILVIRNHKMIYFCLDKYNVCFQYEPDLIDFVYQLGRDFVFANYEEHSYTIRFVN